MSKYRNYSDPEILSRVSALELRVREIVEGYLAGIHRSPYRGFSVEFAEYRPYTRGDELKHVDWKLWARSDRFFVKLYEADTNVRGYFLMDGSRSMAYASTGTTKYEYASALAGALAYLLLLQGDAAGLTVFDDELRLEIEPGTNPSQFANVCDALAGHTPEGETNLGSLLHRVADRLRKRGLVILVSDMIGPLEDILSVLRRFSFDRHAVIAVHVVDPAEAEFPFDDNVRFDSLEAGESVAANAREVAAAYRRTFEEHRHRLESACLELRTDYLMARTDHPPAEVLGRFLAARGARR